MTQNPSQNSLEDQQPDQQQSLGNVQIQGDGNVFNAIQGRDIKVLNLSAGDALPEEWSSYFNTVVKPVDAKEQRLRQVLLNKVKKYWIQDVLEKSLHVKALIELDLEEHLDAVQDPFNQLGALPEEAKRTSLTEQNVVEVFQQLGDGCTLLILGEPGTGKTITLLRLAKDLIAHSEQDTNRPTPVVLNLSSWSLTQQSIAEWLVSELSSRYQVSKELGEAWVRGQKLVLLLDGLDEVKAECRVACAQALNQFLQEHGQTEMVVCCRLQDYQAIAQSEPLQLQKAICIRQLTPEQVDHYLEMAGDPLSALRILLQRDEALQDLAKTPLMLSVMSLAYRDRSVEAIPSNNSAEASRRHLLDAYVQQMFRRRGRDNRLYSDAKVLYWLTQLAQQMERESQTIFLIERMQPSWLKQGMPTVLYQAGTVFSSGLLGGGVFGLAGGLSGGVSCGTDGRLSWNSVDSLEWALVLGMVGAAIAVVSVTGGQREIKPVETFEISWISIAKSLVSKHTLSKGVAGGLIGAIGAGLCAWLTHSSILNGVLLGLSWGAAFGLVLGISPALVGAEIEVKTLPNQGIWRSALNASWVGLSFGIIVALLGQLGFALMDLDTTCRWIGGGSIVLGFGGLGGLVNDAGRTCIRHFNLRLALLSRGVIPWNCARFLDCAVEDIFLQRAGGAYFFIHRTLMDHFAQMELECK
ncbi:NACHT domain-containing protein [Vacuolonema iberomarrocanum]|uniref:NACHT domain-containing protein n=1 Tax=Vacuolonema iberomarrocanum TaxID=3454632 RepID=UPI003F6DEED2